MQIHHSQTKKDSARLVWQEESNLCMPSEGIEPSSQEPESYV